jgi:hypothetical protein
LIDLEGTALMAGDWIKMRTNLDTDPRVIEMANRLGIGELQVVGMLWKVWSWADAHTLDGNAIRVTDVTLDRFTLVTGFADALRKVGWLEGRDGLLTFPRFAEHNGQTAKNRAETKERVAKHRNAKTVTDVTEKSLPEKRREEKNKNTLTHEVKNLICPFEDNTEFEEAWSLWKAHRKQKFRPIGPAEEQQQFANLGLFTAEEAIAMIRYTIGRGAINLITNGDHKKQPSQQNNHFNRSKSRDAVTEALEKMGTAQ